MKKLDDVELDRLVDKFLAELEKDKAAKTEIMKEVIICQRGN